MTGFGASTKENENIVVAVEVKSLNSKSLDLSLRLPKHLNDKEFEIRNLLSTALERGKVNLQIDITTKTDLKPKLQVNLPMVKQYYEDLLNTALVLGAPTNDILRMALSLPEAYISDDKLNDKEEEWSFILEIFTEALAAMNVFRLDEGAKLQKDLEQNLASIAQLLEKIEAKDGERMQAVRDRLRKNLDELFEKSKIDENRFEQELIYYIEKLDINEEKVRLKSHLNYFTEALHSSEANGKKLGFIAQEIGREINTIGSKANDAVVQQMVVQMKEELEKIKEQSLNIL